MGGRSRSAIARDAQAKADAQLLDYQNQQKNQQVVLDKQKQEYKDMEFKNPYAENVFNCKPTTSAVPSSTRLTAKS